MKIMYHNGDDGCVLPFASMYVPIEPVWSSTVMEATLEITMSKAPT